MKKLILTFVGIGFLVYIQSLFNDFVWDDIAGQVVNNQSLYGFDKIPSILFYYWSPYYKPLFYLALNFLLTIFGPNPFPFHLVQLIIHIANSILIFILFSRFFKKNVSFLMSLIFLVHPAISEAVLYISALQDVLYPFFGLIALNLAIVERNRKHKIAVFLFLALSILSKETGIAFLILAVIYKLLFDKFALKKYLIYSGILITLYSILRFGILNISFFKPEFQSIWTYDVILPTRILNIPKIIFSYLTLFVWPDKLQIFQLWWVRTINFLDFYLPLLIILSVFLIIFFYGFRIFSKVKKESFPYFFFISLIVIGFLLHSQIIALDMTLAERWFYLPLIGILGALGYILNRIEINKRRLRILYLVSAVIILLLSARTFIRSFDWKDHNNLVLHDFVINRENPGVYYLLADYYLFSKQYSKSEEVYSSLSKMIPRNESLDNALFSLELHKGNIKEAEEILRNSDKKNIKTRINYAYLLLSIDPSKAKLFLLESLKHFPESYELNFIMGLTEYKLGNKEKALKFISKAKALNPSKITEYNLILNNIEDSGILNIKYGNSLNLN